MIIKLINGIKENMDATVSALKKDLAGIRTGRANAGLLSEVYVESYGQKVPLKQVSSISVPEPRLLLVQIWDRGTVKDAVKAISESGLGLNPVVEGQVIRIVMPDLTEERRKELVKVVHKYGEKNRISIRNVRRDGMDELKKLEKAKEISEDDNKRYSGDIQKITDEYNKQIDQIIQLKEKDLMTM